MTDDQRNSESYARLYDDILDNEKMTRVGTMGFALYCAGLVFSHRNRTDGFIPKGKIPTLIKVPARTAASLVDAGLWELTPGGWRVHDYLNHNASRDEIAAYGDQWRERQAVGGRARAATATRVGGRFSTSDTTSDTSDSYSANQRATSDDQPAPAKDIREKREEGTIPLARSSSLKEALGKEEKAKRAALAKEVGYLWKAHKGWATWPKAEHWQWFVLSNYIKIRPYPIEFWRSLIPTISKTVGFSYLTTAPDAEHCCLAEERHGYWREERWLEEKKIQPAPSRILQLIQPIAESKRFAWQ